MVFVLSCHADYACGRSGACCTAGWAIPVEPPKQSALGAAVLVPDAGGICRFFDRSSGLCIVQRDRGEPMMPESCRHFPRVALTDARGTRLTLSHFCPTAARLLFRDDRPLEIVRAPAAFPPGDYDGLDARGEWPPLVHPTLLFDHDAHAAWESVVVRTLATGEPERALSRTAAAAEWLRGWKPEDGPMAAFLERAPGATEQNALARYGEVRKNARAIVVNAIPAALRPSSASTLSIAPGPPHQAPGTEHPERVIARYLAAKAFASWTAYQGRGVRTLVAELVLADALVRYLLGARSLFESIREADRLLVHLADREPLVAALGTVERA